MILIVTMTTVCLQLNQLLLTVILLKMIVMMISWMVNVPMMAMI